MYTNFVLIISLTFIKDAFYFIGDKTGDWTGSHTIARLDNTNWSLSKAGD